MATDVNKLPSLDAFSFREYEQIFGGLKADTCLRPDALWFCQVSMPMFTRLHVSTARICMKQDGANPLHFMITEYAVYFMRRKRAFQSPAAPGKDVV